MKGLYCQKSRAAWSSLCGLNWNSLIVSLPNQSLREISRGTHSTCSETGPLISTSLPWWALVFWAALLACTASFPPCPPHPSCPSLVQRRAGALLSDSLVISGMDRTKRRCCCTSLLNQLCGESGVLLLIKPWWEQGACIIEKCCDSSPTYGHIKPYSLHRIAVRVKETNCALYRY